MSYWVVFEAIIAEARVSWILFRLILAWVGLAVAVRLIKSISPVVVEVRSKRRENGHNFAIRSQIFTTQKSSLSSGKL